MSRVKLSCCSLLLTGALAACASPVILPDAGTGGGGDDRGGQGDAGPGVAVVGLDTTGVDLGGGGDAASGTDSGGLGDAGPRPDTGPRPDAGANPDSAQRPDRAPDPDAGPPPDAFGQDSSGQPGLGDHCEDTQCADTNTLICIGDNLEAYCRLICSIGGSDCDPTTERCITINAPDGGVLPEGACLPAQALGELCSPEPCAEAYACATTSGPDGLNCRYPCTPSAVDAGCPAPQNCLAFSSADGGACFE